MPNYFPYRNKITLESVKTVTLKRLSQKFDVFRIRQTLPEDINCIQDFWNLVWDGLTAEECTVIETMLTESNGVDYFIWQPCKEDVEKHFRISPEGWSRVLPKGNGLYKITCAIYQVFDHWFKFVVPELITPNILPLAEKITITASKTVGFNKKVITFGNGYSQEIPIGLDVTGKEYSIEWGGLTRTEVYVVEACLENQVFNNPINHILPLATVSTNFYVDEYSRTYLNNLGNFSIKTTLKEDFSV